MSTFSKSSTVRRLERHQWRETQDGHIVVFPRHQGKKADFHGFFELGEFESLVWRKLDPPIAVVALIGEISRALEEMGDVEVPSFDELMLEISAFLSELADNGLIRIDEE